MEAVDSLLNQTHDDFEIIMVDDNSTDDGVEKIVERFGDDRRLKILRSPGAGVVDAINHAATSACGKYFARMDGDDISLPERLSVQAGYLDKHPGTGLVASLVEIFADGELGEGYRLYEKWVNSIVTADEIEMSIFTENPLPNPSVMMRREVFESLDGYRNLAWPEDYDFFLRAYERNMRMEKIDQVLFRWRDHSSRSTRVMKMYSPSAFMKVRAHFLARVIKRPILIWGAGKNGPSLCRMLLSEGANVKGFIDINERRTGGRKVGLPVYDREYAKNLEGEVLILVCVAARGAREEIGEYLENIGKREGEGFRFVL